MRSSLLDGIFCLLLQELGTTVWSSNHLKANITGQELTSPSQVSFCARIWTLHLALETDFFDTVLLQNTTAMPHKVSRHKYEGVHNAMVFLFLYYRFCLCMHFYLYLYLCTCSVLCTCPVFKFQASGWCPCRLVTVRLRTFSRSRSVRSTSTARDIQAHFASNL